MSRAGRILSVNLVPSNISTDKSRKVEVFRSGTAGFTTEAVVRHKSSSIKGRDGSGNSAELLAGLQVMILELDELRYGRILPCTEG